MIRTYCGFLLVRDDLLSVAVESSSVLRIRTFLLRAMAGLGDRILRGVVCDLAVGTSVEFSVRSSGFNTVELFC